MGSSKLWHGDFRDLSQLVGASPGHLIQVSPGEHEQHWCPQVGGDAGIEAEFGWGGDIRVITADDHDRVTDALDRVVAFDVCTSS